MLLSSVGMLCPYSDTLSILIRLSQLIGHWVGACLHELFVQAMRYPYKMALRKVDQFFIVILMPTCDIAVTSVLTTVVVMS